MPSPLDFSLVLTAHRSGPMLEACLDSAAKLDPPPREIIVSIDGAPVKLIQSAQRRGFRVIPNPDKPGVSSARNSGVQAAGGAILLFVDSDILLPVDHVARAAQSFAENPTAAALIGSYDNAPAAPGLISRYRNLLHHYTHQHGSPEAQTFWAGCGAVRRSIFEEVGGFDPAYRLPSVEDIELGYRLRRAGHRIRLVPSWQVKHLKKWTFGDLIVTDIGRRAIPWTRLLRREGRLDNDLNLNFASRASALLVCAGLVSLAGGWFWHPGLLAAAFFLFMATAVNWPFYHYLAQGQGWLFALGSIPLHWLYYLGATTGFLLGTVSSVLTPEPPTVLHRSAGPIPATKA